MTASFGDSLERFNIKERNLLIRTVLGHSQDAQLRLSDTFLKELTDELILKPSSRNDVSWWSDYHLNWIVAALKVFMKGEAAIGIPHIKSGIESNQEDLDLLVWIELPERHLIGIEAKTGHFNGRDWTQIKSKLERLHPLRERFGEVGIGFHFVFMTPPRHDPNRDLSSGHWKEVRSRWPWVYKDSRIPWLPLLQGGPEGRLLLECSCFGSEKQDGEKDHWRCYRPD